VLGVVGGLVIWAPIASLIGLAVIVPAVWALDEALFRMRSVDMDP